MPIFLNQYNTFQLSEDNILGGFMIIYMWRIWKDIVSYGLMTMNNQI